MCVRSGKTPLHGQNLAFIHLKTAGIPELKRAYFYMYCVSTASKVLDLETSCPSHDSAYLLLMIFNVISIAQNINALMRSPRPCQGQPSVALDEISAFNKA